MRDGSGNGTLVLPQGEVEEFLHMQETVEVVEEVYRAQNVGVTNVPLKATYRRANRTGKRCSSGYPRMWSPSVPRG